MIERINRVTKEMKCGHFQEFITPIPQQNQWVWCNTCNAPTKIPRKTKRKSRCKPNPKGNNQYTRGRELCR